MMWANLISFFKQFFAIWLSETYLVALFLNGTCKLVHNRAHIRCVNTIRADVWVMVIRRFTIHQHNTSTHQDIIDIIINDALNEAVAAAPYHWKWKLTVKNKWQRVCARSNLFVLRSLASNRKKKHFKYISCEGKKNRMNCLSKMATVAEQLDEVNRVRVSVHAICLSLHLRCERVSLSYMIVYLILY